MSPRLMPPKPDTCERCGARERLCLWDWVPLWACDDTSACERRLEAQRAAWPRTEDESEGHDESVPEGELSVRDEI